MPPKLSFKTNELIFQKCNFWLPGLRCSVQLTSSTSNWNIIYKPDLLIVISNKNAMCLKHFWSIPAELYVTLKYSWHIINLFLIHLLSFSGDCAMPHFISISSQTCNHQCFINSLWIDLDFYGD